MSPEQARGDAITAATDVFALGLVLYELATGRHPFASGGGMLGAVARMLSETASPPSRWNGELPPVFDTLISSMIDREPRARPMAAEVDRVLSALVEGSTVTVRRASRRTHLVGRGDLHAELVRALDSASVGNGLVVAIGGEPGLGKTALVEHFLEDVSESRPCVIARGRCSERHADGGAAYLPWLELLDSMRGRSGTNVGDLMRTVAPTWHAQVAPLSSGDSPEARALTVNRGGSQQWMKRELWAFLEEASRHSPLLLFFDDVHWADASTIDLFEYIAPRLAASRALILVTYRPSDLARTGPSVFAGEARPRGSWHFAGRGAAVSDQRRRGTVPRARIPRSSVSARADRSAARAHRRASVVHGGCGAEPLRARRAVGGGRRLARRRGRWPNSNKAFPSRSAA